MKKLSRRNLNTLISWYFSASGFEKLLPKEKGVCQGKLISINRVKRVSVLSGCCLTVNEIQSPVRMTQLHNVFHSLKFHHFNQINLFHSTLNLFISMNTKFSSDWMMWQHWCMTAAHSIIRNRFFELQSKKCPMTKLCFSFWFLFHFLAVCMV